MQYKKETHQSRNQNKQTCLENSCKKVIHLMLQYTYPYGNVIRVANIYYWL